MRKGKGSVPIPLTHYSYALQILPPLPPRARRIDPLQVPLARGADLEAGGHGAEADVAGAVGSPLQDAAEGVDAGRWRGSLQCDDRLLERFTGLRLCGSGHVQ